MDGNIEIVVSCYFNFLFGISIFLFPIPVRQRIGNAIGQNTIQRLTLQVLPVLIQWTVIYLLDRAYSNYNLSSTGA